MSWEGRFAGRASIDRPWLDGLVLAKRLQHVPVVLTPDETQAVLGAMNGTPKRIAVLLYGAGLRRLEGRTLRVKDYRRSGAHQFSAFGWKIPCMEGVQVAAPWQGRFWGYEIQEGMLVPLDGEVAWLLADGPKPYWRGRIQRIQYEPSKR